MSKELKNFLSNEDGYKDILNHIDEGIMLIDNKFEIVFVNKKILDIYQAEGDIKYEIVGDFCYKATHGLDKPCGPPDHECPVVKFRKEGKIAKLIHKHIDKNGEDVLHEVTAYPIIRKNQILGFIHVARDIEGEIERNLENLDKAMSLTINREIEMRELKRKLKNLESRIRGN